MNKLQLKEYLETKFELVLENKNNNGVIEVNKNMLDIKPKSADDKCYCWVAEYVTKNKNNEKFYFIYYGKKGTTLVWDNNKKNICTRLSNGVTKHYSYDSMLKQIKSNLNKSNSYLIFFSNDKVIFNPDNKGQRILILNEENIDAWLGNKFDY